MTKAPQVVFVLQAKQPLTTDPAAAVPWPDCPVIVLTDAGVDSAVREDVAALTAEIHHVPVSGWAGRITELAAGRRFEVATNDEYCLLICQELRDRFGLAPRHPTALLGYLDKAVMKRQLAAGGVDTARFVEFHRVALDRGSGP